MDMKKQKDTVDVKFNLAVPKRVIFGAACILIGGMVATAGVSFADNDTSTQTILGNDLIMPYDGYLMIDSSPLTGIRTIKFDLYQSDDAAASSVWSETQTVEVYHGRFSVGLGSSTSLTNTILDAEKLYLGMTILDTDAQGNAVSVELSGRQAIEPAPFAAWSGNSADFNVRGALTVAGAATFDDDTTITGAENNGTLGALTVKTEGSSQQLLIDGDEIDSSGTLYINNNSSSAVDIKGNLSTRGNNNLGNGTGDTTTVSGTLVASQGIELGNDKSIKNVNVIYGFNDIQWRANANDTSNDMKLESDGDLAIYNDLTVSGTMHSNGNLSTNGSTTLGNGTADDTSISGDLSVNGTISHSTSCPSGSIGSVATNGSRICYYRYDDNNNTTYRKAAYQCWTNYGAELCSYNQMTIARVNGQVSSSEMRTDYWLRDRLGDDKALKTNRTDSADNFDGDSTYDNDLDGAFCCITYKGR